jgi:uncharacterized protein
VRRIDLHCHPGTPEWFAAIDTYAEALRSYWNRPWEPRTEEEVVAELEDAGVEAVIVAFDAETETGLPPCTNEYVATFRDRYPETIIQAWGSVDPWKRSAIDDARRAVEEHNVLGFHFHPIVGGFSVGDERLNPLWEAITELGVPIMVDVGTTGMGAGTPGGLGRHLKHATPWPAIDDLAADFPDLTIVAAHPGWPWTEQMIAIALHKANVFWELSGWGPAHFPQPLKHDIPRRLRDKVMFGSDYPSLTHKRLIADWNQLGYDDTILEKVFHENAERVLKL